MSLQKKDWLVRGPQSVFSLNFSWEVAKEGEKEQVG